MPSSLGADVADVMMLKLAHETRRVLSIASGQKLRRVRAQHSKQIKIILSGANPLQRLVADPAQLCPPSTQDPQGCSPLQQYTAIESAKFVGADMVRYCKLKAFQSLFL